jgi:hypothetical protein
MMNRILNPFAMAALAMFLLSVLQPAMASDPAPAVNVPEKSADKSKVTVSPAPSSEDEMSKALTNNISKG